MRLASGCPVFGLQAGPVALAFAVLAIATVGCAGVRRQESAPPSLRRVSPAVAFSMLRDTPDLLVLDLRRPEEFWGVKGHINRAKNIPIEELEARLAELSGYRDRTFLVYCQDQECGARGIGILRDSGLGHAVLIDGGIDAWIAGGFGTVGRSPVIAGDSGPPAAGSVSYQQELGAAGDEVGASGLLDAFPIPRNPWLLPPDRERALALSAAPREVSEGASLYLLGPTGYRKVREGSNGFSCMVRRRRHPADLQPVCFDSESSRTILPIYQQQVEMEMEGRDPWEIRREVDERLAGGEFKPPDRPCIAYALSRDQRVYDPSTGETSSWYPHLMIFYPRLSNQAVGAWPRTLGEVPLPFVVSEGRIDSSLIVPLAPIGVGYSAEGQGQQP